MDTESLDRAKQACLKQSFGAELTETERELLDRFLASDAGRQYQQESGEMKRLLGEVADIEVTPAVEGAAMVTAFETMVRDELRTGRHRQPLALLFASGLGLVAGGLCLNSGKEDVALVGWTMIALGLLCALLMVAIWCKQSAWLKDPDVLLRLEEEQRAGESPRAVFVAVVVGLLVLSLLVVGVAQAGGWQAVGNMFVADAVAIWVGVAYRKKRQARHQELWDWWYGDSASRRSANG